MMLPQSPPHQFPPTSPHTPHTPPHPHHHHHHPQHRTQTALSADTPAHVKQHTCIQQALITVTVG